MTLRHLIGCPKAKYPPPCTLLSAHGGREEGCHNLQMFRYEDVVALQSNIFMMVITLAILILILLSCTYVTMEVILTRHEQKQITMAHMFPNNFTLTSSQVFSWVNQSV